MSRCNPIEMRKNLQVVNELRKAGIDFVPIPVRGNKAELIKVMADTLDALDNESTAKVEP